MDHYAYIPEAEKLDSYPIPENELHHLRNVLRSNVGDTLFVINGNGIHFEAEIIELKKKSGILQLTKILRSQTIDEVELHIAVAPTKNIDRFEFMVEKAVEIGARRITPIICNRSERKKLRKDRLEKISISAMKQSQSLFLTKIDDAISLKDLDTNCNQLFLAHCIENMPTDLIQNIAKPKSTCILIGPEGDFNEDEIEWAISNDFIPISLGQKRLRTETAAIFALSIMRSIIDKN